MLQKYSAVFSTIASLATIPLLLSPALVCRSFIKKGSADHIKPITFVGGLMRSILFFQHGLLMNIKPLKVVHSFGITLYVIYFLLYYKYCIQKGPVIKTAIKAGILTSVLLAYANWESPKLVATRFGIMVTIVHLSLLATPLLSLKHIIKAKSTAGLPFPIIFCAHIVSLMWMLYAISIRNQTLLWQMLIGVALTGFQLSLFVIYPSRKIEKSTTDKKED